MEKTQEGSLTIPARNLTVLKSYTLKGSPMHDDTPINLVVIRGTNTGDGSFYHFTVHLVGPEGDSIRLNPSPSYTDMSCPMRCILNIEYDRVADYAADGIQPFSAPTKAGTTIRHVLDVLLGQNTMDEYIFNDRGQGCRHWCATTLDHLAENGYVDGSTPRLFAEYEQEQVGIHGSKFPMPRVVGTFYSAAADKQSVTA